VLRLAVLLFAALPACAVETQVWDPIPDPVVDQGMPVGPEWPPDEPLPASFDTPPWVTSPGPDRIAIGWRTAAPTTGRVELTRELVDQQPVDEEPVVFEQPDETDLHHVDLGELPRASGYRYRVVLADGAAREGVFTTSGLPSWRFIHLAEVHAPDESDHIRAFAGSIREFRPQLAVESGDMLTDGDDLDSWRAYLDDARPWISNVILLPAHSNHVNGFLGNAYLMAFFELPNNERWYDTRYGDLQIVTLDSHVDEPNPDIADEPDWVRDSMATARDAADPPRFTIGAWHHPACSSHQASRTGSRRWVIENLMAAFFDSGGIDLVLVGHDKYYERSRFTSGANQVVQVMSNAGRLSPGTAGNNEPECTPLRTDIETRSITQFSVGANAVIGEAVDEDGVRIDTFAVPIQ
jgi:hypothetical protein